MTVSFHFGLSSTPAPVRLPTRPDSAANSPPAQNPQRGVIESRGSSVSSRDVGRNRETDLESESGPRTAENANRIVHDHMRVTLDPEPTASVLKLGHGGHVVCSYDA